MILDKNFPPAFADRVSNDKFLGDRLLKALNLKAPTSIRYNHSKLSNNRIVQQSNNRIAWCKNAYYLSERPVFTKDPLFHAGVYYPQEAGSMILDKILRQVNLPEEPIILDLCAAPGGKSTLIASFLNEKGLLVSNEVIQIRSKILTENLIKWGNTNTIVTNNDPKDFQRLPELFDVIVVDAPCSGEGMFRKDIKAREEWSENNVELCAGRQKRIVMDVWDSLKAGGYLIYSTCTFNEQENEVNIECLINETKAELLHLDFSPFKRDRKSFGAYALPSELETEGFYIAVLQKKETSAKRKSAFVKNSEIRKVKELSVFEAKLNLNQQQVIQWKDFYFVVPSSFLDTIKLIHHELRILKLGTEIGIMMKNDWQFHHALAMNPFLLKGVPSIPVDLEQALLYLKGETFTLLSEKETYLLSYENCPLGWIKHLGNRFNNLYPKEWRIRMKL